ncbi:MAG: GtrA family protein [Oscillospiraceae bacterium]|nr:GtrA family protein [Oscillospiraceae bacterium]
MGVHNRATFFKLIKEAVMFSMVGVVNTLLHLGTYYLLMFLGVHYIIANAVGFVVSIVNAYFMNSRLVFKNKNEPLKSFAKLFAVYGTTFLLATALLWIYVEVFAVPEGIAPLINILVVTPINFLLNKFWTFKK